MDAVHLKLRPHGCDQCDYRAAQMHTLKVHVESMHQGKKRKRKARSRDALADSKDSA